MSIVYVTVKAHRPHVVCDLWFFVVFLGGWGWGFEECLFNFSIFNFCIQVFYFDRVHVDRTHGMLPRASRSGRRTTTTQLNLNWNHSSLKVEVLRSLQSGLHLTCLCWVNTGICITTITGTFYQRVRECSKLLSICQWNSHCHFCIICHGWDWNTNPHMPDDRFD